MLRRLIYIFIFFASLTGCAAQVLHESKLSFANQDFVTAFKNMLPLAEKGNAEAQYAIGYMYYYGKGTVEDQQRGEEWIRKAAAQGQTQAVQAMSMFDKQHRVGAPDPLDTINSL